MSKTLTLRLDDEAYELFSEAASAENRSMANLIQTAAMDRIREQQFVDDYEMAEIKANDHLLQRLKAGSRDARQRRGRFVE